MCEQYPWRTGSSPVESSPADTEQVAGVGPFTVDRGSKLFGAIGRFEFVAQRLGEDRPFSVEQAAAATYRLAVDENVPTGPVGAAELADPGGSS